MKSKIENLVDQSKSGEVVCSSQAWSCVERRCDGTVIEGGNCKITKGNFSETF